MLNLSRKIKSDKGSITSFTLLSMLFFLVVVIAIYASVNTKVQKQGKEIKSVQDNYKQENIDDIYENTLNGKAGLLATYIKVGDYVAYDATNNYSYTSPKGTGMSHGNGYADQTFTSSSDIKWRVFYKNVKTGEIVLISEGPIKTDKKENYTLKGAISYIYAEEELNKICAIYGHGVGANTAKKFNYETGGLLEKKLVSSIAETGARSITLEDVDFVAGYDKNKKEKIETKSIYYPTKTTESGYSLKTANITEKMTSYGYNISNYLDTASELYKLLCVTSQNNETMNYWLASRSIYGDSKYYPNWSFNVQCVDNSVCKTGDIMDGYSDRYNEYLIDKYGVRPVVYLKSTLKVDGKDSNGAWKIKE